MINETYTLSNGVKIPKLGLGTWFIDDDKAAQAVREAVKLGYRLIDTAQAYGNERGVGEGIRTCGVDRDQLFVTTKLAAEIKSYDEAVRAIDGSLKLMGLDYIDMIIIHSPQPWVNVNQSADRFFEGNLEAWRALEEAYKAGKLRAIGVSNFDEEDIDNLCNNGSVKPMVNQILAHIGNTPFGIIDFCKKKDILVEAYSPVAHGVILEDKEVEAIAKKYDVSIAQLCIRYCLQLGLLPLPKTANPEHMKQNGDVDFVISDQDMKTLCALDNVHDYGQFGMFPVYGGKM